MVDPVPAPEDSEEKHVTPRWVKIFAIVVAVIALLLAAVLLLGGGNHGPNRHMSFANATENHTALP
jgi:L-asparagine transporter-like permease